MSSEVIEAIANGLRHPRPGDRASILDTVDCAPFNPMQRLVRDWEAYGYRLQGLEHPRTGQLLGPDDALSSLEAHTLKHTLDDSFRQGTTPEEYLDQLRSLTKEEKTRVKVGLNQHGEAAAVLHLTVHQPSRSLPKVLSRPRATLFVVYNGRKGHIVTGYVVDDVLLPQRFSRWKKAPILVTS